MSFLYPGFLFALSAISVPIIIHLFNFRRYKKVHFSNVSFLQALQMETRKRSRLRQWLILAARILTVACLVLAFTQPFIPGKNADTRIKGDKAISIFIDNSFSMQAQGNDGRLQDMAVDIAKEIVKAAGATDKIQVLTQDFESRHQVFYSKDEALQLLEEIKNSSSTHFLSEITRRQQDMLNRADAPIKRAYIISDFQQSSVDIATVKEDSMNYQLIPLTPNKNANLYIDSVWLLSPELAMNTAIYATVRIVNKSNTELKDQVLNLEINEEDKLPVSFSVGANASVEVPLNFVIREAGYQWGRVYISDAEILFDDDFYFGMYMPEKLNILHIKGSQATGYIDRLFTGDAYFQPTHITGGQVDFSTLSSYQMVILDELQEISGGLAAELKKFADKGGSVFVIPATNMQAASYTSFLNSLGAKGFGPLDTADTKVAKIDKDQPFFTDVFESIPENMEVPAIKSMFPIQGGSGSEDVILNTASGKRFFVKNKTGRGSIYQLAVPLQDGYSNFAKNILFVPVFIKAALQSVRSGELYYTIGLQTYAEVNVPVNDGDRVVKIRSAGEQQEFIPEQKTVNNTTFLYFNNQVKDAGIYQVMMGEKEQVGQLAFNYNRKESIPETYTGDALQQQINEKGLKNLRLLNTSKDLVKKQVVESDQGIRLWKLFIILALVFIAIEIVLARFMK